MIPLIANCILALIAGAVLIVASFMIEWEPSASNRWYSVIRTNELTSGFTSLIDDIEYPQNNYTDSVYGAEDSGFYRVEVEMK
jgi:hypothetical protein